MISFPAFTCKPYRDRVLPDNISKVVGGEKFTVILTTDGELWGSGDNTNGQLGTGGTTDSLIFQKFSGEGASGVTDVDCGGGHTVIHKSGVGYGCGVNNVGQYGTGDTTEYHVLTAMNGEGTSGITGISAGYNFTVVHKSGVGYGTGYNWAGALGTGNSTAYSTLTAMTGNGTSGITLISGGGDHTTVSKSGVGYACGYNWAGVLGTGNSTTYHTLTAMNGNGTSGITLISAGYHHTMVVKSGVGYGTGINGSDGRLGTGNTTKYYTLTAMTGNGTSGITALGVNHSHIAVSKSGIGYACGRNVDGQCGTNNTTQYETLTKCV